MLLPTLALIVVTVTSFGHVRRLAAWLMLPYFVWTCYIAYVTAGVWWLNPHV